MDYQITELIGLISSLATEVTMVTQHDVFFNMFGHTKQVDLRIHINGWREGRKADIDETVYYSLDHCYSEDTRIEQLQGLIETLEYFKEH